jgi:hypothetical protein
MFPFRADWVDLRFLHFRVEPAALQPFVPHPLDLFDGAAWVSLVAFEQRRFRPVGTGVMGAMLFKPVASHPFLNVRTYVRCNEEPGIFFLAEWVPRWLAGFFGPRTWGLPYRLGTLDYRHDTERGISECKVAGDGLLQFSCSDDPGLPAESALSGSREEFLFERYTAFTQRGKQPYAFRIAHPPWRFKTASIEIMSDTLLSSVFTWYQRAGFTGAHASSGMPAVALGAPARIRLRAQSGRPPRRLAAHS